jgi:hypothetical protein
MMPIHTAVPTILVPPALDDDSAGDDDEDVDDQLEIFFRSGKSPAKQSAPCRYRFFQLGRKVNGQIKFQPFFRNHPVRPNCSTMVLKFHPKTTDKKFSDICGKIIVNNGTKHTNPYFKIL